jgi:hexosaminidase
MHLESDDADMKMAVSYLVELLKNSMGFTCPMVYAGTKRNSIDFFLDSGITNEEGYSLDITTSGAIIKARTAKGIFYAVQTLRQLMPAGIETRNSGLREIPVPAVEIEDTPRFVYRGVMLDVARHFFTIGFLKKYIDLLACYKINKFHLHLTDDQGWRIEIKKYPRLQTISAWRKETQVGYRTDTPKRFDGIRHGGYYTQQELIDLVRYARQRFITIIPEIDIPGHSQAVLAAYPQLGCIDSGYQVSRQWGVHQDILCPKEETFAFLEDVFTELIDIFPGKYIHIGGDEVPKDRWKESPFCQTLIKKLGLKDEHELQSYFIGRIEKFLNAKGRAIIGWDEILEGGIAPNATIMSWHGEKGGIAAAKEKHDVIMTPSAFLYFNFYQTKNGKAAEPLSNGNNFYIPLRKIYGYNPVPSVLAPDESKYILGLQGCLWTEYVASGERAENLSFPRVCALAEAAWTPLSEKNYSDFVNRLNSQTAHLRRMNVNFSEFYRMDD